MPVNPHKQRTKITVLKVLKPEEVLGDNPPITPSSFRVSESCPIHTEGQTFTMQGAWPYPVPEEFCEAAWQAMYPYILTIHNGRDFLLMMDKSGVVVTSCPDGFRPVVFKIERLPPAE